MQDGTRKDFPSHRPGKSRENSRKPPERGQKFRTRTGTKARDPDPPESRWTEPKLRSSFRRTTLTKDSGLSWAGSHQFWS